MEDIKCQCTLSVILGKITLVSSIIREKLLYDYTAWVP